VNVRLRFSFLVPVAALAASLPGVAWGRGTGSQAEVTLSSRISQLVARPGGLSADEVAARAVATSYNVRQRQLDVMAAAAGVDQALVGYFPRLSLQLRFVRLSDVDPQGLAIVVAPNAAPGLLAPGTPLASVPLKFDVPLNQTTLQATLAVPLSEYVLRIPEANKAIRLSRDAARFNEQAARLQIAADARLLYYNWARARLQAVVAEQALVQTRAHLDAAKHLFEAGSANKADVLRVEAQVASTELFLTRARNLEVVLEDQLRTAMHAAGEHHYEIGEDLRSELPAYSAGPFEQLLDEAFAHRFELKVLGASRQAQKAQAKVALADALPHLDLFGDLLYANPNQRYFPLRDQFDGTWDVGVSLRWSPNETAAGVYGSRVADAKELQVAAQLGAVRDGLRNETMQSYQALRESDFAVQSTARGLDAAEESYRVRRELFQNGRATSIELTDAETDLTQARLNAVAARIDQRIARVRLTHAIGRDADPHKI
jgi:outer membrane protein